MPLPWKALIERLSTQELREQLFDAVVEHGSIAAACRALKIDRSALWRHARDDEDFGRFLDIARQVAADAMIDGANEILNEKVKTPEDVQDKRIRFDGKLRLAGKLNQKYADKPTQQHMTINSGQTLVCDEQTRARLVELRQQMIENSKQEVKKLHENSVIDAVLN